MDAGSATREADIRPYGVSSAPASRGRRQKITADIAPINPATRKATPKSFTNYGAVAPQKLFASNVSAAIATPNDKDS